MKTVWARLKRANTKVLHCWVGYSQYRSLCGLFTGTTGKSRPKPGILDQYRRCKNCQRALKS